MNENTFLNKVEQLNEQLSIDDIWKILDEDNVSLKDALVADSVSEKNVYKCDCVNPSIICSNENMICSECGSVLAKLLSESNDARFFNDENNVNNKNSQRTGPSIDPLLPISSTTSVIAGNSRLSKINSWNNIPYEERVIIDLKRKLQQVITINDLPTNILYNTLVMYKTILNLKKNDGSKEIHRGKIKTGLIAFCLYYSAKNVGIDIIINSVIEIFEINKKIFNKCSNICYENLDISRTESSIEDLVTRLCNKLSLPFKIQSLCKKILLAIKKVEYFDKFAIQSLASGLIYFITKEIDINIDVDFLASLIHNSVSTILKVSKCFSKHKIELFNIVKQSNAFTS